MAKVATVIHTRTRLCDFPSNLAVYPRFLDLESVEKIRKQILAATRSIDSMGQKEVRRMIYTCDKYVVAGMVSFLNNLADNIIEDERFYTDEKGRKTYAFVGFVFKMGNQSVPSLDKKILWDSYKRYMEPVWERTVLDTMLSDFVDIDFQDINLTENVGAESVSGMTLYATGVDNTSVFYYWLGQALQGKSVSFCSNITDFRLVKDRPFEIINTTANIVERMKKECANDSQKKTSNPLQETSSAGTKFEEKSNKVWVFMMGGLLVLIVLIVTLFLSR